MRSSKSRSRSKSNRSRPTGGGNVVNRVFDSSGPEGKVRGTPQQIIDKYNQLSRDAQLSNDRVAVENFQQHAEHYMRMLGEAQREQDARREEQERQNRERQAEQERQNRERQAERDRERTERQERDAAARSDAARKEPVAPAPIEDPAAAPQPDVLDLGSADVSSGDSGLVETPESKPKKPNTRRPRTRKAAPKAQEPEAVQTAPNVQEPEAIKVVAPVDASMAAQPEEPKGAEVKAGDAPEAAE